MIDEKKLLKDIAETKKPLGKKYDNEPFGSHRSDYLKGYVCALSAVEGLIAKHRMEEEKNGSVI